MKTGVVEDASTSPSPFSFFSTLLVPSFHPYEVRGWNRLGFSLIGQPSISSYEPHSTGLNHVEQTGTHVSLGASHPSLIISSGTSLIKTAPNVLERCNTNLGATSDHFKILEGTVINAIHTEISGPVF